MSNTNKKFSMSIVTMPGEPEQLIKIISDLWNMTSPNGFI
jgi:hypothetical protein